MKIPYNTEAHTVVWAKHPQECTEEFLLDKLGVYPAEMINSGWKGGVHQINLPDKGKVVQVCYREGWAALYSA